MLLRSTVIALLAANALYYGWSHGLLAPIGLAPAPVREPQRMEQQIRPETLQVTGTSAPAASAPASSPAAEPAPMASGPGGSAPGTAASAVPVGASACLQAGPFDAAQTEALRQVLTAAALPAGSWTLEGSGKANRWIVYMGRYADAEALDKKRAELRALRVDTAPIGQPALAPGLSLGVFSTPAGAQEHLAQLSRRGVRTARVVPEHPDVPDATLRLPAADAALAARVRTLSPRPLTPC
jgi:hypothetical protein